MKKFDWLPVVKGLSVSRYWAMLLLLVFFLVSSAWVFNLNSRGVNHAIFDEWHTLVLGTQHLSPFAESVPTARVGEMNRWFIRLLHPAGVYYMNSHMGGEHYLTGWEYPGGYYLREHFKGAELKDAIRDDPNIQDYVFFLRTAFGVLAVFSFSMVMWALSGRFGIAAAATYGSLVLVNPLVFLQFRFFYSETTLFILFNTAAFLCLRTRPSATYRTLVWSGVLSAAALSTKLTGILIVGPLFVQTVVEVLRSRRNLKLGIEVYLLSAAAALVLLNLPSQSLFTLLNETLANVYHYKTGHLVTAEGGVRFLRLMLDDLGYVPSLLFAVSLFWLVRRPRRRLVPIYVLGLLIILVIWSSTNVAIYLDRNMASVYVAMSFIVALGVGSFVESFKPKHKYAAAICSGLAVVLMASELVRHQYQMPSLVGTFFERNVERMKTCGTIGAIGLSKQALRALSSSRNDGITIFDRVEGPFNISQDPQVFDKYLQYDCLIVHRKGQSKQISNFVAPQHYRLSDRVGNLFFFSQEMQDHPLASAISGEPAARGVFDIYLSAGSLIFVKVPCARADTEARYFLHLIPAQMVDLPNHRRRHGFDNLDFDFDQYGERFDGKCLAKVPLPEYRISEVTTGQYVPVDGGFDQLWKAEFRIQGSP